MITTHECWQEALRRLSLIDTEPSISETEVDEFLAQLPKRFNNESLIDWLKRGQRLAKVIAFPKLKFQVITDIQRLAADTSKTKDELPKKPLLSSNSQFRLTVTELTEHKVKLFVEALNLASSRYANRLIGIAGEKTKDDLISVIQLDEMGEGFDVLENIASVRQALLHPVIALIEQNDA